MSSLPGPSLAAWLAPERAAVPEEPGVRARGRRVTLLIVAMVLMSMGDLLCTLTYMRTSGMIEMNPVARAMISIGDAPQLIMFKLATIAVSCGMLYLMRRHAKAEVSAWACAGMLFALTLHWTHYNRSVSAYTNDMAVLALSEGRDAPEWVTLER
jgi:hypothetical protein